MERPLVRLQNLLKDTEQQISQHYKSVVQLEEQTDDNNWQLMFCQGAAQGTAAICKYLEEGDLAQALMRLQTLRVQIHCDLSEFFRKFVSLKAALQQAESERNFYRGVASVSPEIERLEAGRKVNKRAEDILEIRESIKQNDFELHSRRGFIASLDAAERMINEEIEPSKIPSAVDTSPGVVGPNFDGQAMDKPDKIVFGSHTQEEYNTEYEQGRYERIPLSEMVK